MWLQSAIASTIHLPIAFFSKLSTYPLTCFFLSKLVDISLSTATVHFAIITARARCTTAGCFHRRQSVCPHLGGGRPQSQVLSQVSGPISFLGGTPASGPMSFLGGGPVLVWKGVPQSQMGLEYPTPGWGYPTPVLAWGNLKLEYPQPGQNWVPPARTGLDTPQARTGLGYHPEDWLPCGRYASCGFPQEDFLVYLLFDNSCQIRLSNEILIFYFEDIQRRKYFKSTGSQYDEWCGGCSGYDSLWCGVHSFVQSRNKCSRKRPFLFRSSRLFCKNIQKGRFVGILQRMGSLTVQVGTSYCSQFSILEQTSEIAQGFYPALKISCQPTGYVIWKNIFWDMLAFCTVINWREM